MPLNNFAFFEYLLIFLPLNLDSRSFTERLSDLNSEQLKLSRSVVHRHDTCHYFCPSPRETRKVLVCFGLFSFSISSWVQRFFFSFLTC